MAKFSKKVMGKEVGDAAVYAEPHTMKGKKMNVKSATKEVVAKSGNGIDKINMSVGIIARICDGDRRGQILVLRERGYSQSTGGSDVIDGILFRGHTYGTVYPGKNAGIPNVKAQNNVASKLLVK
jgi:hypothetical protein